MFRSSELAAWLDAAGIKELMYYDGQDLGEVEQDLAVVLTLRGGGPSLNERTFDTPTLQVITRGSQNDPKSAEDLAFKVDDALLIPDRTVIGETYVASIDRLGGPPSLLQRDTARRNIFTCNYFFQSARMTF